MPPRRRLSTAGSRPAISPSESADGYYTLCGRRSDLIISGGFNIYPREIEEFLMEQPEVAEAAVVGEPDRVRGEVPGGVRGGRDGERRYGRPRSALPREARVLQNPAAFRVIEKLPRNALGKGAEASLGAAVAVKILMVTSEAAPFAKTGGLADVLGCAAAGAGPLGRRSRRGSAALSRRDSHLTPSACGRRPAACRRSAHLSGVASIRW